MTVVGHKNLSNPDFLKALETGFNICVYDWGDILWWKELGTLVIFAKMSLWNITFHPFGHKNKFFCQITFWHSQSPSNKLQIKPLDPGKGLAEAELLSLQWFWTPHWAHLGPKIRFLGVFSGSGPWFLTGTLLFTPCSARVKLWQLLPELGDHQKCPSHFNTIRPLGRLLVATRKQQDCAHQVFKPKWITWWWGC